MSKSNIAKALAKAQMEMGKAYKDAKNPHFKSKYADLATVMEAVMPALNANGIAVIQPTSHEEYGLCVSTVFIHGESGENLYCDVPLNVSKNDMQGLGSAITYARRYGLQMMAGIAPEDDDGNAAVASAPKNATQDQIKKITSLVEATNSNTKQMLSLFGVTQIAFLNVNQAEDCLAMLNKKMAQQVKQEALAEAEAEAEDAAAN